MKPISEFPYDSAGRIEGHPMHERMLVLRMNNSTGPWYTLGYYDAINDVFEVLPRGHYQTKEYHYDKIPVAGNSLDHRRLRHGTTTSPYKDFKCIMPKGFLMSKGQRCITHFLQLDEALDYLKEHDLFKSNIDTYLDSKPNYFQQHLLCTRNNYLLIADIGCFADGVGTQFAAFSPSSINGNVYHSRGAIPRDDIRYYVNLVKLGG